MNRYLITLTAALFAAGLLANAASAREHRVRPPKAPVVVIPGGGADAEDPIDWMRDYDEAAKLAAQESRALFILITTEDMERTCQSCRFQGDVIRRAVRDAKVVPVKLLPPPVLDLTGLKPEEAKKRQEVLAESRKKYEEVAKRFGVTTVPSLVYAAPDAAKLAMLASPSDDDIRIMLTRLPEMIKAHAEAVAKEDKKADPVAVKGDPAKLPDPKKPEPPKDNKDDF